MIYDSEQHRHPFEHRKIIAEEVMKRLDVFNVANFPDGLLDDLLDEIGVDVDFALAVGARLAELPKQQKTERAAARRVIAGKPAKKPAKPKPAKPARSPAVKYQPGTVAQRVSDAYRAAHGKTAAKTAAGRARLGLTHDTTKLKKRDAGPSPKHKADVLDALEKRALDIAATGIVVAGDLVGYALATRGQVATVLGRLTKAGKLLQRGKGRGVQYTLPNGAAAKSSPQLELDDANA